MATCKMKGKAVKLHNEIRDFFKDILGKAGCSVVAEKQFTFSRSASEYNGYRMDLVVNNFPIQWLKEIFHEYADESRGQTTCVVYIDVTAYHPYSAIKDLTERDTLSSETISETKAPYKEKRYGTYCKDNKVPLITLPISHYGYIWSKGYKLLTHLIRKAVSNTTPNGTLSRSYNNIDYSTYMDANNHLPYRADGSLPNEKKLEWTKRRTLTEFANLLLNNKIATWTDHINEIKEARGLDKKQKNSNKISSTTTVSNTSANMVDSNGDDINYEQNNYSDYSTDSDNDEQDENNNNYNNITNRRNKFRNKISNSSSKFSSTDKNFNSPISNIHHLNATPNRDKSTTNNGTVGSIISPKPAIRQKLPNQPPSNLGSLRWSSFESE